MQFIGCKNLKFHFYLVIVKCNAYKLKIAKKNDIYGRERTY